MARNNPTCDVCKQPARIVAKLFLMPIREAEKHSASNYTAHLDVGECCVTKMQKFGAWQKRKRQGKQKNRLKAVS